MTYARPGSRPRAVGLALALALIVTAFLAFSLPPYLRGDSRVPPTFDLHYPLLVAHVLLASVAMFAAVAQIWPGLRIRRPVLHRTVGRIYVVATLPAASSALVIGALTPFGPILAVSNIVLATLWLWFTVAGFRAVRQRRFVAHRRHMIRSAALALSIITNRIWTPLLAVTLQPLQHSVFRGDEQAFTWLVAGLVGWLGWTVPLTVVQWWLSRTRHVSSRRIVSRPRPAGVVSGRSANST